MLVAQGLLRAKFALAAAADARTRPLYALFNPVAFDTALVQLRVSAPDMESIRVLAFGAYDG